MRFLETLSGDISRTILLRSSALQPPTTSSMMKYSDRRRAAPARYLASVSTISEILELMGFPERVSNPPR